MNACQDQGREAVTIEPEDVQKTLCSQLADNSMTTVKKTTTKQKNHHTTHLVCFHSASSEIIFYQDRQLSFRVCFSLLSVTGPIISGPNPSKKWAYDTSISSLTDPLQPITPRQLDWKMKSSA